MIKAFGKSAGNCSEKDLSIALFFERDFSKELFSAGYSSSVLNSASGFAVILIPFSVRWLTISEQSLRAGGAKQMVHSE